MSGQAAAGLPGTAPGPGPVPLRRNSGFQMLWIGQLLSDTGSQISLIAYPLLILALTHSPALAGVVGTAREIALICVQLPAGALSDRIDRRRLLIAGWLFYAVIYAVFPFARSLAFFAVLFVLYAIPGTLSEGAERAWISDLVPAEARGKSFGIYYLANGLCVLAGTVLFGEIYQHVTPQAAFWVGSGLALLGAAAVLVVPGKGDG